jgi:hypothetical protein
MRNSILLITAVGCFFSAGCSRLNVNTIGERVKPSNDRDWIAELDVTPFAEFDRDQITLKNIRRNRYLTNDDYVLDHFDRTINIEQIQSVDYIVVPFNNAPQIAHTMLSFGLDDDTYLGVSVEVRREKGEGYSAWRGLTRQLELMYVLADERDLIGVRTSHRESDVYIYPTIATPKQAQALFTSVVTRMNKLAGDPEFYHTLSNNCTTNLKSHVNELRPNRIPYAWKVLLPAHSAEYAYDLGLLDRRIPFKDLQALALVRTESNEHLDNPRFSQLIRAKRDALERMVHRQSAYEGVWDNTRAQPQSIR